VITSDNNGVMTTMEWTLITNNVATYVDPAGQYRLSVNAQDKRLNILSSKEDSTPISIQGMDGKYFYAQTRVGETMYAHPWSLSQLPIFIKDTFGIEPASLCTLLSNLDMYDDGGKRVGTQLLKDFGLAQVIPLKKAANQ